MKKRRRIEITAFRRRTTIVLRERSSPIRRHPEGDSEKLPQQNAELARSAPSDLDQTQTAVSDNPRNSK